MRDPRPALEEFSTYAHEYCINLNDMIDRKERAFCSASADVYQGNLRTTGSQVAVKTGRGRLPGDEKTIKKVVREAHVWSKLDHKNVLPLIGITTDFDVSISLVSKWMTIGTAHDYVQDRSVDPRPLVADIARGLYYLHNHPKGPIIHGDLKGSNVLISDEGHALISDFGYTHLDKSSFNLTVSPPCGGTLNWMAPEILDPTEQENVCSVRSDVWAFGMTILELYTRKNPFPDLKNCLAISRRILSGPPDRPSDDLTCCRMTHNWWAICSDCWECDPLLRPSMSNLLSRIESTEEITNLTLGLNMLSERAVLLDINLNHQVTRNPDVATAGDSAVIMSRGVLEPVGTKIILQIIRASLRAAHEETVENILQEVLLWSKVHHTNVIPVFGITTKFDYTLSIVSAWAEMKNAYDYVQNIGVDPGPLLLGIANGLEYLHSYQLCPLIHGDLRGINVLVREGGHALITFGITPLVNSLFEAPEMRPLNWVSPEELESGGVTKTWQGDVWAFGMTVLELFTRKSPFHGTESESDLKLEIMRGPPERPSVEATCGRLTGAWWSVCLLCWERDPLSRPTMSVIVKKVDPMMQRMDAFVNGPSDFFGWSPGSDTVSSSSCLGGDLDGVPQAVMKMETYSMKNFEGNTINSATREGYLRPPTMDPYPFATLGDMYSVPPPPDCSRPAGEVGDMFPTFKDPPSLRCQYRDCHMGVKLITRSDILAHMKSEHGFSDMPPEMRFTCGWAGCGLNVTRHNFVRHLREVHLGYRRPSRRVA